MSSSYFYRCRGQARELAIVQAMRSRWFKRHFSRDTLHLQAVSRRDGLYVRLDPDHAGNGELQFALYMAANGRRWKPAKTRRHCYPIYYVIPNLSQTLMPVTARVGGPAKINE
jgi:hypothetical protein